MRESSVDLKRQVAYLQKLFYDLWNDFGSVYLVVGHSARTRIGRRGFTDEEKKHGLVLVFNDRTSKKMEWDDEGNLSCVLAFGARKEDVYIHHDDLRGVFSPEAGVQFLRGDMAREPDASSKGDSEKVNDEQVVSLSNFRKRKTNETSQR
jgi:hypothetical protein